MLSSTRAERIGARATAARDAVKKEALRRAGIGYEEIVGGHHTPAELRRVVEKVVRGSSAFSKLSPRSHRNPPPQSA
jgi:hypothetical protein